MNEDQLWKRIEEFADKNAICVKEAFLQLEEEILDELKCCSCKRKGVIAFVFPNLFCEICGENQYK